MHYAARPARSWLNPGRSFQSWSRCFTSASAAPETSKSDNQQRQRGVLAPLTFEPDEIAAFLALLPATHEGLPLRHAIEARHESFDDPAFFDLCRKSGTAVVLADSPKYAVLDAPDCAPFVYARLQNARADLETGYPEAELDAWAERARGWASEGREVFAFFINGAKERAPAAAMGLIGIC